jgi:hypothetical protein
MLEEGILETMNVVLRHLVRLGELSKTFWWKQIAGRGS